MNKWTCQLTECRWESENNQKWLKCWIGSESEWWYLQSRKRTQEVKAREISEFIFGYVEIEGDTWKKKYSNKKTIWIKSENKKQRKHFRIFKDSSSSSRLDQRETLFKISFWIGIKITNSTTEPWTPVRNKNT